ncbi:hypothetical protein [Nonomuraea basaltis]|uniref:hypothetical protein n=1 Tax=Nonomuraea basaltis TaxID=2495887 RepID=UPI00110C4CD2|nr:hypothetical protein [Nonomuraea basaltis]TMR91871.1 hypothetical protein EJK15_47735 [Nonomuraea basaltis]
MNWTERDLPEGRRRLLKEFVMTEIDNKPPRKGLPRLAILAPALGLAAAVAVTVPLLFGGGPAYALAKGPDGLIHITINQAKDPKKLQEDLRAMGANVVVDYIPRGKKCSPQPRSSHFAGDEEKPLSVFPPSEESEPGFTIDPKVIGAGEVGVLEFSVGQIDDGSTVAGIWARVGKEPIAPCELVDTTDAPLSH